MKIEDIKINIINKETLRAIASVNLEGLFVVHGIRLIEGKDGMFLSFPAKVRKDGSFSDIAHPINADFREEMTSKVIDAYNDAIKEEK